MCQFQIRTISSLTLYSNATALNIRRNKNYCCKSNTADFFIYIKIVTSIEHYLTIDGTLEIRHGLEGREEEGEGKS